MSIKNRIYKNITWGELDPLGIVFYPRFYEWMDEASHIFFDKIGLNLVQLLNKRGIIFALVETSAKYIKPLRYQDEIELVSSLVKVKDKTLLMRHEILKEGNLAVEGHEKRICLKILGQEELKAISIPDDIRDRLNRAK